MAATSQQTYDLMNSKLSSAREQINNLKELSSKMYQSIWGNYYLDGDDKKRIESSLIEHPSK